MKRCEWAKSELDILYHDLEWGVPTHDDNKLFEFIVLESAQSGLSWSTILKNQLNLPTSSLVAPLLYIGFAPRSLYANSTELTIA